jgi:hypothetical protein
MRQSTRRDLDRALRLLEQDGLLLLHDRTLPSLSGLVAKTPVSGSWWGHRDGNAIYAVATAFEEHADVLACKLVDGKVTFVHRRLWPALIAVGRARAPWQMQALSPSARALLERVERDGRVRPSGRDESRDARSLEAALLVLGQSVHTDAGHHALELVSWPAFAKSRGTRLPRRSPAAATGAIEQVLAAISPGARLPWQRAATRKKVPRAS